MHRSGPTPVPLALLALLGSTSCALLRPDPTTYEPVTLPSGVVVHDQVVPEAGPRAQAGDVVSIDYELYLEDGERVDSTYDRGRPARFELGAGEVPPGVDEGLQGMRLFGQRRILVPAELGYGEDGLPPRVPPGAALRFDVELMELERDGDPLDAGTSE